MDLTKIQLHSTDVVKVVEPYVDTGNLVIMDRVPIEPESVESGLLDRARDNTQLLFNKIWSLERKTVDNMAFAKLPTPSYRLPREKRIPEPKEPTKWEKYAKEKGIAKKTKDKKVYDEHSKEWKPTYGYKRANDDTKVPYIEIPGNGDIYKDYFAERKEKKKERVAKNETQRLKNLARQLKTKVKTGPSIDSNIGLGIAPEDKSKQQVRFAIDRAKAATASVGKFQRLAKGEKENVKTGKKRQFQPTIGAMASEKSRSLEILERIKNKKPKTR
ncbi:unnamed protein product [Auanema sp. JU1783]|nr:unnamed protein product [Auanema sp. JU1783]